MSPPLGLQFRLGALFLLVAVVPGSIVMAFAFYLDGPTPRAVGICLFTLLPTVVIAFLLGHFRAVKIFTEATELLDRLHAERDKNIRLAELDRLRSELVSSAAHELRTPLSSLTVYLDTLAHGWDTIPDDRKREIARRSWLAGKRMNRLVTDLLLAAQIQAAGLPVQREPVSLLPLIEQARAEVMGTHPEVPIDLAGGQECVVLADSVRVQQVLVNLLDNAAKFAEPGSRVHVAWERQDGMVAVTVSNRGEILSGEQLDSLFLPFSRLATGTAPPVGTGLGLFISKKLVEAMGGAIAAAEKDRMMAFSFTLRAAPGG